MSNNVAVEYTVFQRQAVQTEFKIHAFPMKVSQLQNDLNFQTKTEVDTALANKQDKLIEGEGISIVNNVISATGATITIDDELSTTSKNPVQNKVVTGAINQNHTEISNIGQTIGTYGDIVTHNASEFATSAQGLKADTALQPSALVGYATQTWVGQQGYITGISSSDVTTALGYTPYNSSNPSGYQTGTQVADSIATETTNRENADIGLQNQIDAIVASSDVFDIVGTYAELQAYDISTVPVNDIIKVLVDSTHSNAATYYRCVETGGVKSWSYIGSEGAYYTKGEADSTFVPQTRTVNSKALSGDITLTASDVGADASGSASTAETNAKNYADSLASNYATSAQGALADTAVQPADLANMQTTTNLVTSVSSASTDTQYPSAKLFYDTCGDIEATLNAIRGV